VLSRLAWIPVPAIPAVVPLGNSVSGQTLVQPLSSVQVSLPPCSELSRYRVWPLPLTRTVPTPGRLAAVTVMAASALAVCEAEAEAEGDDAVPVVVDLLQAASARTAAAPRAPAPNQRRAPRFMSCDVCIGFSSPAL